MSKIDVVRDRQTGDDRDSIGTLFGRVPGEIRSYVVAQVSVYKIEATRRGQSAGMGAAFFIVALILLQAAVVALLVGLIILISMSLGTGWAIAVVVGTALILTAVFAWLGLRQIRLAVDPDGQS